MERVVKARKPRVRPSRRFERGERAGRAAIAESLLHELRHDIANPLMAICASTELVIRREKKLAPLSLQRLRQVLTSCDEIQKILDRAPAPSRARSGRS